MRGLPALLVALAFLPGAVAQHEHHEAGAGVMIGHDSPADGRAFVGNLAHFAVLDLGKAGDPGCFADGAPGGVVPQCHQQNHVRVTLNGVVLMETTPDSGHDYDGVYLFDVAFPAAGNYTVSVLDDEGAALSSFSGYVVDPASQPPGPLAVTLKLDAPSTATAGALLDLVFETDDAAGALVKHSDAWFEVRRGTDLVFRTKTHTHDTAQAVSYAFPQPGTYTVRVTSFLAFPSPKAALFAPVMAERTVTVTAGASQAPGTPMPAQPDPPLENGLVLDAHDPARILVGTYDPWTTVGPATQMRLTLLAMDPATRMPVPHVDFAATLKDSLGRTLYASDTLHEYDGIHEFAAVEPVGEYTLSVDATQGTWKAHVDLPYTVMPPLLAALPPSTGLPAGVPRAADAPAVTSGAVLYDVAGLDGQVAGTPFNVTLTSSNLLGQPFPHSEVDYQVLGASGIPALAGKLHTHDDGTFQFTVGLSEGSYRLVLAPMALEPEPVLAFHGKSLGDPLSLPFQVAPGPGFSPLVLTPGEGSSNPAPGPGFPLALGALALGMALRRRA
ncbi:MAG TPA: hypothetical protein VM286_10540 [Candidatus Thermoplasmatota archaeon]|nr:hypothetical protein [Candidatus Thermoplasmatota archaeon]